MRQSRAAKGHGPPCVLGCLRVSRNLEKNLPEAPQAPKFLEICHTPLHLPPRHTQYTCTGSAWKGAYGPRSLGGLRQCLSSNCLAIFGPSPPQPRRAARRVPRAALAHRAPPSSPAPPHPRAALAQCPSTRGLGRPRWAGFTPRASMVPYRTCRPRRGRSGSGCSRRLPSGCTAHRRTSITVGKAESCEHTDQEPQGFEQALLTFSQRKWPARRRQVSWSSG